MLVQSRKLKVFTAASYLLVITVSAFFHNHYGQGEGRFQPGVSAAHSSDEHDCSVCQFLAQKPAPVACVAPVGLSALVQEVAAPAAASAVRVVFAAWHSRAPPVLA